MLREGEEKLVRCVVAAYSDTLCFADLAKINAPIAVIETRPASTLTAFNTLSIVKNLEAGQVVLQGG